MSRAAVLIYAGVLALIALLSARTAVRSAGYIVEGRSPGAAFQILIWWSLATFAAPLLSLSLVALRRRTGARYISQLLFLPAAIALYWVGARLFFMAAGRGGDDIVAEYALVGATALLFVTLLFHAGAMVRAVIAAPR